MHYQQQWGSRVFRPFMAEITVLLVLTMGVAPRAADSLYDVLTFDIVLCLILALFILYESILEVKDILRQKWKYL